MFCNINKTLNTAYSDHKILDYGSIEFTDDLDDEIVSLSVSKFGPHITQRDPVEIADHITQTLYELTIYLARYHLSKIKNTLIVSDINIEDAKGFTVFDIEDVKKWFINALLYFDTKYILTIDVGDEFGFNLSDIGFEYVGNSAVNGFKIYFADVKKIKKEYLATDYCQF